MSRKLTLLAAAFAFSAIVGAGSVAHAQAQSDMIPPGASLPGGSTVAPPVMGGVAPMGRTASPGYAGRRSAAASGQRNMSSSRAERRQMARANRPARAANRDAAYMGGGGVFERSADGSLRPVM